LVTACLPSVMRLIMSSSSVQAAMSLCAAVPVVLGDGVVAILDKDANRGEGSQVGFPSVSVVVPALNEERNIPHVFGRIPEDVHQVVLVDGRSVDNTVAVARRLRPDVCVVSQTRKGKGNALACGFEAATGDVIAMVDADGSADPGEIPRFVAALQDGADFAKGTRFLPGGGSADIRLFEVNRGCTVA